MNAFQDSWCNLLLQFRITSCQCIIHGPNFLKTSEVSWGHSRSVPVQNLRKVSCIHTAFKTKQTSEMLWCGMVCYASFFFLGPIILQGHCSHIKKKPPMKGSLFPATCQAMEPLDLTGRIGYGVVEGMSPSYVGPGWEHHMWMFCFSQPKPDTDTLQI